MEEQSAERERVDGQLAAYVCLTSAQTAVVVDEVDTCAEVQISNVATIYGGIQVDSFDPTGHGVDAEVSVVQSEAIVDDDPSCLP